MHKHLLFVLSTSFLLMLPFQSFAEDKGWIKSPNGWQYMEDGAPVVEEWRKSGNEVGFSISITKNPPSFSK